MNEYIVLVKYFIGEVIDCINPDYQFEKEKYDELNRLSKLLFESYGRVEELARKMAVDCPHMNQKTYVENHYTMTRCLGCHHILSSRPLPGIPWDLD